MYEWQIVRTSGQRYSSVRTVVDMENGLVRR